MMKYFFNFFGLAVCTGLVFIACNESPGHGGEASLKNKRSDDVADKMLGIWASVGDENASFAIDKDSIFYPDHNGKYKYIFRNDSLHIKFDDYDGHYLVRMRGADTLVLVADEQNVFYRFDKGR